MQKITVAKGDGIGPEIMNATLEILLKAGAKIEIEEIEVGEKVYLAGNTLEGNHSKYLKTDLHELLVIELSVTKLCRSLLKYSFIHKRLQREKLSVTGIVLNPLGVNKKNILQWYNIQ